MVESNPPVRQPDGPDERSWVKLDRYAIFDIGRRFDLTPVERWALLTLTLHAHYRSAKWTGTVSELAAEMDVSTNTARPALKRLEACGLIRMVRPFGPNRQGVVLVFAYQDLRVGTSRSDREVDEQLVIAQNCANEEQGNRAVSAQQSRSNRAAIAQNLRGSQPLTSENGTSRGGEEAMSEGVKLAARGSGEGAASRAPEEQLACCCESPHFDEHGEPIYCPECGPFEGGLSPDAMAFARPRKPVPDPRRFRR